MDQAKERTDSQRDFANQFKERMKEEQMRKVRNYRILNRSARKGSILFTGSSLMEHFPICEMAASAGLNKTVYNRGIGGTTTDDFLREIDTVMLEIEPSKIFINIGTNDMTDQFYGDQWMDHLFENYETIIRTALERLPNAEIYMMAYYPANLHFPGLTKERLSMMKERTPETILACNLRVEALANKLGVNYIDVSEGLADERGEQKLEFSVDGVHMYANAYEIVFQNLRPYL